MPEPLTRTPSRTVAASRSPRLRRSALTWVTATLGALGGVLIGLTLSYCDSVVKNLALSCAIILTALLDNLLFSGPLNLPIAASAAIILASIVNYSEGA